MTLGVFSMGMLLGNTVGAPLGGALAGASYQYPFFLGGALLLVMFAAVALFGREGAAVTPSYSFGKALAAFKEHPRLGIPYSFSLLDRLTVGFFVGTFPVLAAEIYGFDAKARGIYLAVFLACFAFLSPLGGIISDRFGRARPMLLGTVVYGLMLMLVGRASAEMLYVVMAVGGISGALLYPPSIAMVGDYAGPRQRGVAMGGFNLAGSIGFALGPLLFSFIADTSGLLTPPLVAGGLCLVAAAVAAPLLLRGSAERVEGQPYEPEAPGVV
jgi:MFS family permease